MPRHILVLGDILIDRYFRCSPGKPNPEIPSSIILQVDRITDELGGTGNVIANLDALLMYLDPTAELLYIGPVQPQAIRLLQDENIEFENCLDRRPYNFKCIKNRLVTEDPYRVIQRFDEDEPPAYYPEDVKHYVDLVRKNGPYDLCLVSDYAHGAVLREVLIEARKQSKLLIVDPKATDLTFYYTDEGEVQTGPHLHLDAITPNFEELARLNLGITLGSPHGLYGEELTNWLYQLSSRLGGTLVIHKQGSHGCSWYQRDYPELKTVEAYGGREVRDVCGAGDTFVSTLAVALLLGHLDDTAVEIANRMAGISVGYQGCFVPDEEHIKEAFGDSETKSIVVTGCYDRLHFGHIRLLKRARAYGRITVLLNSEKGARELKGEGIEPYKIREADLLATGLVEKVLPFDTDPTEKLKELRPDTFLCGDDHTLEEVMSKGGKYVGEVIILPRTPQISSTLLRSKGGTNGKSNERPLGTTHPGR